MVYSKLGLLVLVIYLESFLLEVHLVLQVLPYLELVFESVTDLRVHQIVALVKVCSRLESLFHSKIPMNKLLGHLFNHSVNSS